MACVLRSIGRWLARYFAARRETDVHPATRPGALVAATLQPGERLLVEGTSRFSAAIKCLTQPTRSHAALYLDDVIDPPGFVGERPVLIEADVNAGMPFGAYAGDHTRICRPHGLAPAELGRVRADMSSRLGYRYDIRNIADLARYLVQAPPVPPTGDGVCWRQGIAGPTAAVTRRARSARRRSRRRSS